jgi:hypothetical protein
MLVVHFYAFWPVAYMTLQLINGTPPCTCNLYVFVHVLRWSQLRCFSLGYPQRGAQTFLLTACPPPNAPDYDRHGSTSNNNSNNNNSRSSSRGAAAVVVC